MMPLHPAIEAFQASAEVLNAQGSRLGLDDAIVQLAGWLDLASDHLTDDDVAVLIGIGATLYREGLRMRSGDSRSV